MLQGCCVQHMVVEPLDQSTMGMTLHQYWLDIWSVLVVVLGQELPNETATIRDQTFSLAVAAIGLAAFALVLALVEQVSPRADAFSDISMAVHMRVANDSQTIAMSARSARKACLPACAT